MSVRKMVLVNIVGPAERFDHTVEQYLVDREIQMEDAIYSVEGVEGVRAFADVNPYSDIFRRAQEVCAHLGIPTDYIDGVSCDYLENAEEALNEIENEFNALRAKRAELVKEQEDNQLLIGQLSHMMNINIPLEEMFNLEFMSFRFGRMSRDSFEKLTSFLYNLETFFLKGETEGNDVYGIYITPHALRRKVDAVFDSLHFERIRISDKATGEPEEACRRLKQENERIGAEIAAVHQELADFISEKRNRILCIYSVAIRKYTVFGVRKMSARTDTTFYITGWMPEDEARVLSKQLEKEDDVMLVSARPDEVPDSTPPTALRNPRLFRPFEFLVKMYGVPSYNEVDPTVVFGITYVFMFGMMFGDLGQGAVLVLLGLLGYKMLKLDLGAVLTLAGVSSMVFGLLYGSVFGSEELLPWGPVWLQPMKDSDSINALLITAIQVGVVFILSSMGINLYNAIKTKDYGRLLFSHNGLAGILFYVGSLALVLMAVTGQAFVHPFVAVFVLLIPLSAIFLQEPLSKLVARKKDWWPKNKGEFVLDTSFEMFDILLSFITNTISFVRVGAFALIHVGMMMVVYIFVHMTSGVASIIVLVVGNLFVMALEGLIVGIQVLRLEFYEMFSRFFRGEGRAFTPLYIKDNQS